MSDDSAPRLAGIHHVKIPVTDLERSLAWYRTRLGYEVEIEFREQGQLMGVSMKHPNGGPRLALRLSPERARAVAGFDYFAIGVDTHAELEALAAHLTGLGEQHDGVHLATVGWILPATHDPDGHEVRFYTWEHHVEPGEEPAQVESARETAIAKEQAAASARH